MSKSRIDVTGGGKSGRSTTQCRREDARTVRLPGQPCWPCQRRHEYSYLPKEEYLPKVLVRHSQGRGHLSNGQPFHQTSGREGKSGVPSRGLASGLMRAANPLFGARVVSPTP